MPRRSKDAGDPPFGWAAFEGFDPPRYTPTPDVFFDLVMPFLTGAELKVILYIVRHTFGYKKAADEISVEQMVAGIVRRDGTRVDYGTQLARSTVLEALRSLVEKGLIVHQQQRNPDGTKHATLYALRHKPSPLEETWQNALTAKPHTKEHSGQVRKSGPTRRDPFQETTGQESPPTPHDKYSRGRYPVCPACHSRPHAEGCPRAAG